MSCGRPSLRLHVSGIPNLPISLIVESQNKDHSASNTRTTDNDAQFIPIYTKLVETLHHNTSLSFTMSCTCPIAPFYNCAVVVTSSEHQ